MRTALALSMCTGQPLALERIRAKRSKPGLMRQHLTCVHAAARLTRLARPSVATVRLDVGERQTLRAPLEWSEPTPAATLARRVALELGEIDVARLKRCERPACDLVFYDTTRSATRRWHAESPCGNRERQRRYRAASCGSSPNERR